MRTRSLDAVIVGAGPNGLTAAALLAREGLAVRVLEAADTIGGGARTAELAAPGFWSDLCSAVHPLGISSPAFRALGVADDVEWILPPAALAHPFEDGGTALLRPSLEATARTLGGDARAWTSLMAPFMREPGTLFAETLRPIRLPRHPLLMLRFARHALRSCDRVVRRFADARTRALFAGCSAHSFLPLDAPGSAAFGLVLALSAHAANWPLARGGSRRIAEALAARVRGHGGEIRTGHEVRSMADLPDARAVLFDLAPVQVARIAGAELPARYRRALERFRHGPGTFKVDWALAGPIPWRAAACSEAPTVHLGATYEEIRASEHAAAHGRLSERPFVILVQQGSHDPSRVPPGRESAWAYCHVPNGCAVDMTAAIERQVERLAPGFGDLVLARHVRSPAAIESHDATMVGGDISGGANDLLQLLFRPVPRWNPYATPNPRLFLCSSSTPPGGGVHGMCGYWAARAALRRRFGRKPAW